MTSKINDNEKVHCPRCLIKMDKLYQRSYGTIEYLYGCPKCKGIIQK